MSLPPSKIPLQFRKLILAGLLIGVLGVNIAPLAQKLEENLGLHLLFRMRGARPAPTEVVIVSLDKTSADQLNLHEAPRNWPRKLHAQLIDNLYEEGAAVIAFDLFFDEKRSAEDDILFARAMKKAGNVILCECITKEKIPLAGQEEDAGHVEIVRLKPPNPVLARSAAVLAPFPLPKVPVKISQYWTFKTEAGDLATLPAAAFQLFAMDEFDAFVRLLKKYFPEKAGGIPDDKHTMLASRSIEKTIRNVRNIFRTEPSIGKRMLAELSSEMGPSGPPKKLPFPGSLIKMYEGDDSRYLNFYGPPGAITTVSYYQALQQSGKTGGVPDLSYFKGKAVFVGLSELTRSDQKDGFYTVFSQQTGIDISGVEIAATAFANLLEDRPVRPVSIQTHLSIVLFWGFAMGLICLFLPTWGALMGVIVMGGAYISAAHFQFKTSGVWLPLIVPLCFQAPVAFFTALVWKYARANRERRNIRRAFGYYLPDNVVDRLAQDISDIQNGGSLVYGTCLCTDAEKYATLSETMNPEKLSRFMNRYYEAIFEPVRRNGGIVSDVVGDSMLAIWASAHPDPDLRRQACLSALDIVDAVDRFNRSSVTAPLPTRLGLDSGRMVLGSIGAVDHYEYRAVGDVVNSASRLESLNKHLGTRIIVSGKVLHQLDGFLVRSLGKFLLAGKSNAVRVYELICRLDDASDQQRSFCTVFDEALGAFMKQSWHEAIKIFGESKKISCKDGPSEYYLQLCEHYLKNPPEQQWDGSIRLKEK